MFVVLSLATLTKRHVFPEFFLNLRILEKYDKVIWKAEYSVCSLLYEVKRYNSLVSREEQVKRSQMYLANRSL